MEFLKTHVNLQRLVLWGYLARPSGTGKTLLAKAVAGEASDVPFFSISGSEFVEMFVGVQGEAVFVTYSKTREKCSAIIFIDEIDAVGRQRGAGSGGRDEHEQTLNQLLVEWTGSKEQGIIVIAATNRSDVRPTFVQDVLTVKSWVGRPERERPWSNSESTRTQ